MTAREPSSRERPSASRRLKSWLLFSLGLNAALLGSVAWLALGRGAPAPSASSAGEGFPPDFMARPPREGGFPPAFVLKKLRGMARGAGVTDEQWTGKIEPALGVADAEFLAKIEAMRRSRLETARAVAADPDADLARLVEESLRPHAEASLLMLQRMAQAMRLLEPAQREAFAAMIDEKLKSFDQEAASLASGRKAPAP